MGGRGFESRQKRPKLKDENICILGDASFSHKKSGAAGLTECQSRRRQKGQAQLRVLRELEKVVSYQS